RSTGFQTFPTDKWVDQNWPQLHIVSLTMILVAIAPPFWGLFWAMVQPTQARRSLRHMKESHEERLLRLQQEAEVKRLKAETNARGREAQWRGSAQTAATAREQAAGLLKRQSSQGSAADDGGTGELTDSAEQSAPGASSPSNVVPMPMVKPAA